MKSLIVKIVSNSEKKLKISNLLKKRLGDSLISVLTLMLPELNILVESKGIIEPLNTTKETQERLFDALIKYFNCFIDDDILVIVIDDLQWIDAASFEFLEILLKLKERDLFIIGAYRDNEINESHSLISIIDDKNLISEIKLQPLKINYLNEMVSETLQCDEELTMELSELIFKKTLGNPFFSREFINTLYEEELIFNKNDKWNWNVENMNKMNFSSNVIDFMIKNLKKKGKNMQKLLNRASCIGNTFKINELKWIWDEETLIENELIEPMKEGWIYQINSNEYQFFHDKLQEASYELYEKSESEKIHSIIGNRLYEEFKKQNSIENNIFNIINHLNISKSSFNDQKELIRLNIIAAKKSLENSASEVSLRFSGIAMEILSDYSWENDYQLCLDVYSIHAKTLYSNSKLEESEEQYNILLEHGKGTIDRLTIYASYMKMASLTIQYEKAYALFVTTFQLFDFTSSIPLDSIPETFQWIFGLKGKIDEEIKKIGSINDLLSYKKCEDTEVILFLKILFDSLDIIFMCPTANPLAFVAISLISLYVYVFKGLDENAAFGLGLAGWINSFFFKDKIGFELTTLAEKLFSNDKNPKYNIPGMRFVIATGNITGGNHRKALEHLEAGSKYAKNHGEYLFGSYCSNHFGVAAVANGENLSTILKKVKENQVWMISNKNYFIADFMECLSQFIMDLCGISEYNPKFIIPIFPTLKCADSYVPTMEGTLFYHKGKYEEALKRFEVAEIYVNNEQGLFDFYEMKLYYCLTMTRLYKDTKNEELIEKIEQVLKDFKGYADISPEYLEPRYKLMETYFKSIQSTNVLKTAKEFEDILDLSIKYGLVMLAAVTSEILVEFGDENEFPKSFCQNHFNGTMKIWNGISAKSKIEQFNKKYFKYWTSQHRSSSISSSTTTGTTNSITRHNSSSTTDGMNYRNDSLDMMSIIKASQALSVELTTSSLIDKVMSIIIENTGAECGYLFLIGTKGEFLECSIQDGNLKKIHKLTSEFKENEKYCSYLFSISKSIKKTIMISDLSSSEYSDDTYIQREGIKSICIHPIFKGVGNKYIGTIYLENKTLDGIFDENRKEILEHISSQLAISYENAKLYDDMNSLNLAYERFLPKEFLNQIGKGDVRNIKIGDASTKKISVLFSDIRSFTNLTEKMNPKESFSFVNQILSYLAPIISKHNGFIDKFLGDCIMALFPYNVDDSIKCGFEMQNAMKLYNKECRIGLKSVSIGIGIHFGDVMLGTIGAEERIDATVISDTVNTASRVESLTKTLGAKFVVTDDVLKYSKNKNFKNRYIGNYLLKGKEIPMKLFHMLSENDEIDEIEIEIFNKGINLFESNKFKESEKIFSNLKDKTSNYLKNVSKKYQYYHFDSNWNGEISIDKDGNLIELSNELLNEKRIEKLSNEDEKLILNSLLKNDKLKDFLKSWSKQSPEIVHSILDEFEK